ncbi:hypothetical protein [Fodinicola feengrottensis]|uniref:Uncharacterized protein n=1 Tax=Fodinicola feengrottensis TaxID=435914 RepID=A0ABN2IBT8_9ACTN|nr:hypothetical protein [Fodinicola feengrottensis]
MQEQRWTKVENYCVKDDERTLATRVNALLMIFLPPLVVLAIFSVLTAMFGNAVPQWIFGDERLPRIVFIVAISILLALAWFFVERHRLAKEIYTLVGSTTRAVQLTTSNQPEDARQQLQSELSLVSSQLARHTAHSLVLGQGDNRTTLAAHGRAIADKIQGLQLRLPTETSAVIEAQTLLGKLLYVIVTDEWRTISVDPAEVERYKLEIRREQATRRRVIRRAIVAAFGIVVAAITSLFK